MHARCCTMKFGFDIDDILIDLRKHAFTIYNQKLGKNVPLDQFTNLERVEIHELFDLTDEQGVFRRHLLYNVPDLSKCLRNITRARSARS